AAAPAGNVKGHRDQIAHVQKFDVAAFLDDLAGNLMPQHQAGRSRSPAAHHVLIAAADIGGDDPQKNAMINLLALRVLQFRKVNRLNLNFTWTKINYATIGCHQDLLRMPWRRLPPRSDPVPRTRR